MPLLLWRFFFFFFFRDFSLEWCKYIFISEAALENQERERREREERERRAREERERREREEREREEQERREQERKAQEERERKERERKEREGQVGSCTIKISVKPPDDADNAGDSATSVDPQDPPHFETSRLTESLSATLQKDSNISPHNFLESYTFTRGVQTEKDPVQTDFSPAFCSKWDLKGCFNSAGGVLQKPKSDVILKVPPDAIARDSYVDVYMSVCVDIARIHESLQLPEREHVASPLVEFWAGEDFRFRRTVQITLPQCLHPDVDSDKVVVYRATQNIHGETILDKLKRRQPQESKLSRVDSSQQLPQEFVHNKNEATYRVSGDGKLFISTGCFSSYVVCTHCDQMNRGCPTLMIVGSGTNKFRNSNRTQTASVKVHIWDSRLTIRDYKESIVSISYRILVIH